jgi:hypothetical protein
LGNIVLMWLPLEAITCCPQRLKCNVNCFPRTWRHFPRIMFPYFKKKFITESIFYQFYYFPKFSFSAQNLFLLSILQHVIASKGNHINYSHCYCCLCHVNRIHTCNVINILIGHQLSNDDFINDGKCFTTYYQIKMVKCINKI